MHDKIDCINAFCKGDGCGLTGGTLVDIFVTKFLTTTLPQFKECHVNESDCIICKEKLSFKKINGKSTIALNWSKNPYNNTTKKFTKNMIIINLKEGKWWKRKVPKDEHKNINFFENIPAGIFLIDKYYCKENVMLSTNNKTNTLIESKYLYMMLQHSITSNLYIQFPKLKNKYTFDILSAFVE